MQRTVYFEFIRVGNVVKVSAIDSRTGTEVSIVGSPKAGQETLKRVAARKLRYVMEKRAKEAKRSERGL